METPGGYPFGDLLRGFRKRARMSQTELAKKLNVSRLTISNWEEGNYLPKRRIQEIADALSLDKNDTDELTAASVRRSRQDHSPIPTAERNDTGRLTPIDWNRRRMLEKVHVICIQQGLEKSLYSSALIRLGLQEKLDAVTIPWKPILQEEMKPSQHDWLPDSDIGQVYDDTHGELLILGEAGSGKTTLLLQLTRILLERAWRDDTHPIPAVFNMSSWAASRLPLSDWLVEELNTRYQVPRKLGQSWVESDQMLPLLDGLDEVTITFRPACVEAINAYRREHGFVPTVACSRSADYLSQADHILLSGAIIIQPLTQQQIDEYLAQGNGQLEAVRTALVDDPDLRELVTTPLMLNALTLAYYGEPVEELPRTSSLQIRRQRIFSAYIQRMLQRRVSRSCYSQQQNMRWLAWLAGQLARHNQSEFYLERMQMDWLPESRYRSLLPAFVVGLVYGLLFAFIKSIDYGFMQGVDQYKRNFTLSRGILDGLLIGVLNTLLFTALNGFIFGGAGRRAIQQASNGGKRSWREVIVDLLKKRPMYGLLFGLLNGLLIGALVDPPAGLYNGLFISVIYAFLGKLEMEIKPAEVVSWSWEPLRRNLLKYVGVGVLVGFLYGLFTGLYWQLKTLPHVLSITRFLPCVLIGLALGLVFGLIIVMTRGLTHDELDTKDILKPNQGIWNSARNSMFLGLLCWALFGLFLGVIYGVLLNQIFQIFGVSQVEYGKYFPKDGGLILGLANGLAVGAFFWLRSGGTACIQHLVLRAWLWQAQYTPYDYPLFLDEMVERLILRRIGGGYAFLHPLLRDYFVSVEAMAVPSL